MRRFFIPPEQILCPAPFLTGEEARHLLRALRMKVGDLVVLFDNSGQEYPARISLIEGDRVYVELMDRRPGLKESPLKITVGLPLIRPQPFEWILQKGTELGVASFHLFYSTRSRQNFPRMETTSRQKRWQRIIREAAKQCQRNELPVLKTAVPFDEFLKGCHDGLKIVPYEKETSRTLKAIEGLPAARGEMVALVGPEGGFNKEEINRAEEKGFIPVSLGPRILRSETAVLALICLVQFLWGDLGSGRKGGENALP
jgi:16S rRNA (uracil1498-N3)-methyltransferase